jgi:transposase
MSQDIDMNKKPQKPRKNRIYSTEFKQEAIRLAGELGVTAAARQLGIPMSNVDKWKSGIAIKAATSPRERELLEENKKLKRELERSEAVNEILKKTAAIFSKEHLT